MTKTVFLLLLLCYSTQAEQKYSAVCSNSSQSGLTFEATSDGVPGRYKVEWCTAADRNVTNWELVMRYIHNPVSKGKWGCTHGDCENCNFRYRGIPIHSCFNEKVHLDLNCTNICFSTKLDLIFNNTCYQIKTFLQRGFMKSTPDDAAFYKLNNYTMERFTASKAYANSFSTEEELVVLWHLDIPATDYTMELCRNGFQCQTITNNCTIEDAHQSKVRCALAVPFGNYTIRLQYQAPWINSELFQSHIDLYQTIEHSLPALPAKGTRIPLWWLCVMAAFALLIALLLLHSHRRRFANALREKVLHHWLNRAQSEPSNKPINNNEVEEPTILLLYARDCAQFARVAEVLRQLLIEATGCKVIDLYSAETVRESARAPGEWLQRLLSASNVRVVLLQSPAAALHAPTTARQPLLIPTIPHPSDWLLSLALRRLAETGHVGLPYRKYFVAEIAGLEADVLPYLTRLRRYSLPAAALTLIQDLTPDTRHDTYHIHNIHDTNHTQDMNHTHKQDIHNDKQNTHHSNTHRTHTTLHTNKIHYIDNIHDTNTHNIDIHHTLNKQNIHDHSYDTNHTQHTNINRIHDTHDTTNDMYKMQDMHNVHNKQDTRITYENTLQKLAEAVDELIRYVRDNPDYIIDLLHVY